MIGLYREVITSPLLCNVVLLILFLDSLEVTAERGLFVEQELVRSRSTSVDPRFLYIDR